jgi:xanthine dehydrogenase YagS FAD-binding subunit
MSVLGARFKTTERLIEAGDFFSVGIMTATVLKRGELLTEIQIPLSFPAQQGRYKRFAFRKSIDFPVINLAISTNKENRYRICLGGVAPVPYRALNAETLLEDARSRRSLRKRRGWQQLKAPSLMKPMLTRYSSSKRL